MPCLRPSKRSLQLKKEPRIPLILVPIGTKTEVRICLHQPYSPLWWPGATANNHSTVSPLHQCAFWKVMVVASTAYARAMLYATVDRQENANALRVGITPPYARCEWLIELASNLRHHAHQNLQPLSSTLKLHHTRPQCPQMHFVLTRGRLFCSRRLAALFINPPIQPLQ